MELDISKTYLVLAYNYQRYLLWCDEAGIDPHGPGAKYIYMPEQMVGYKAEDVVIVQLQSWWVTKSRQWYDLMDEYIERYKALGAEQVVV